jgi:hypothetical protein
MLKHKHPYAQNKQAKAITRYQQWDNLTEEKTKIMKGKGPKTQPKEPKVENKASLLESWKGETKKKSGPKIRFYWSPKLEKCPHVFNLIKLQTPWSLNIKLKKTQIY